MAEILAGPLGDGVGCRERPRPPAAYRSRTEGQDGAKPGGRACAHVVQEDREHGRAGRKDDHSRLEGGRGEGQELGRDSGTVWLWLEGHLVSGHADQFAGYTEVPANIRVILSSCFNLAHFKNKSQEKLKKKSEQD